MDYNIFKSPLRHFIKAKINGGAVLLFVAAAAMIIANTPLRETYDAFFPDFVNVSPKNHLQIMGRYVDVVS